MDVNHPSVSTKKIITQLLLVKNSSTVPVAVLASGTTGSHSAMFGIFTVLITSLNCMLLKAVISANLFSYNKGNNCSLLHVLAKNIITKWREAVYLPKVAPS